MVFVAFQDDALLNTLGPTGKYAIFKYGRQDQSSIVLHMACEETPNQERNQVRFLGK